MRIRPLILTATLLSASAIPFAAGAHAAPRPPAEPATGPDVWIEQVALSTYDFRKGDKVQVTATVRRQGIDIPVRVRCYVDTGRVDQVADVENVTHNHANFEWQATYDAGDAMIIVGAYAEPIAGEENIENNGLWRVYFSSEEGQDAKDPSLFYAVKTHAHLTEQAIKLANIPEVTQHADRLVYGATKEDSFPDLVYGVSWFFGVSSLWTRHFWDVDQGEAGRGLWGRESALEKGRAYLFGWPNNAGAYELYKNGNKSLAYEYLGRALHFIEDVSTPAHVHGDAHAIDDEEAEKWGKKHAHQYTYDMVDAPYDADSFYAIMEHAAQLADSLPSDDVEGDTEGFTDPGGWTPLLARRDIITWNFVGWDTARPEGMKQLFDRTMPMAIAHAAGMIRLFYRTLHPGQELPEAATGGAEPTPPLGLRHEAFDQ